MLAQRQGCVTTCTVTVSGDVLSLFKGGMSGQKMEGEKAGEQ